MNVRRGLVAALASALCLWPLYAPAPGSARGPLGPFAELAAEIQWLRYEGALTRGEEARALALAERALELVPGSTTGWQRLAWHQGYDLCSPENEPELARRREWFAACQATVARGLARAELPGELELFLALLFFAKSSQDPELAPGGSAELLARGEAALTRAAELGQHDARELLPGWHEHHPPAAR